MICICQNSSVGQQLKTSSRPPNWLLHILIWIFWGAAWTSPSMNLLRVILIVLLQWDQKFAPPSRPVAQDLNTLGSSLGLAIYELIERHFDCSASIGPEICSSILGQTTQQTLYLSVKNCVWDFSFSFYIFFCLCRIFYKTSHFQFTWQVHNLP